MERCKAVDPVVGTHATDLFAYFREILSRDTELVSIITNTAMAYILASIKHSKKSRHDGFRLQTDVDNSFIVMGMELIKVEEEDLCAAFHDVFLEMMTVIVQSLFDSIIVSLQTLLLLLVELEDRIIEKGENTRDISKRIGIHVLPQKN